MIQESKTHRYVVTVIRFDERGQPFPWETLADTVTLRPNGGLDILIGEQGHFLDPDTWDSFGVKRKKA